MRLNFSVLFSRGLNLLLAGILAFPVQVWADHPADFFLMRKAEGQDPAIVREMNEKYDNFNFVPTESRVFPQGSIPESYKWVLARVPEAIEIPEAELQDYFVRLILLLKMSQNGHYYAAKKNIPSLTRAVLEINTSVSKIISANEARKDQIMADVIRANFEWAFVVLGKLTVGEKKRIALSLSDVFSTWTNETNLKKYIKKQNINNFSGRMLRSVFSGITVGVSLIGAMAWSHYLGDRTVYDLIYQNLNFTGYVFAYLASLLVDTYPKRLKQESERVISARNELLREYLDHLPDSKIESPASFPESSSRFSYYQQNENFLTRIRKVYAYASVRPLSEAEFNNLLIAKIPTIQDNETFFQTASTNPEHLEIYDNYIKSNEELNELAKQGQELREYYLSQLREGFGNSLYQWAVDPEVEILNELKFQVGRDSREKSLEIPIQKAQSLALEETINQFGLSSNIAIEDLEKGRFNDQHVLAAYNFFRRRFFQLQSKEVNKPAPTLQTVEQFKDSMQKRINEMRIWNLQQAVKLSKPREMKPFVFQDLQGKNVQIPVGELLDAQFRFSPQTSTQNQQLMGISSIKRIGRYFYEAWVLPIEKRSNISKQFYIRQNHQPSNPAQTVFIRTRSAEVSLSEEDFNRMIFGLSPPYETQTKESQGSRYLLEASRRDSMFSDALTLLYSKNDSTIDNLKERLKFEIRNRTVEKDVNHSLTEKIKFEGLSNLETATLVENVRWGGYRIHPDYWVARNEIAKKAGKLSLFGVLKKSEPLSSQQLEPVKQAFKFAFPKKDEPGSEFLERVRSSFGKSVAVFGIVLAFSPPMVKYYEDHVSRFMPDIPPIYGPSYGPVLDIGFGHMGPGYDQSGDERKDEQKQEKPKEEKPKPAEKSKDESPKPESSKNSSDSKSESDTVKISDSTDPSNVPQDENERNSGKVLFEIVPNQVKLKDIPTYMNMMTSADIPENRLENEYAFYEKKSTATVEANERLYGTEYAFAMRTNYFHPAKDGLLPVVSPSGYRAVKLELVDSDGRQVGTYDYKLFIIKKSGLNYATISDSPGMKKYKYVVYFKKLEQRPATIEDFPKLKTTQLINLTSELSNMGATELSTSLNRVLRTKTEIDADEVSRIFAGSGIYTYDKEDEKAKPGSGKFGAYTKFLRNGVFYYQCSGSNRLFNDYLKSYYTYNYSPVEVLNIKGFVRSENTVKVSSAHIHNMLTRKDQSFMTYELDATPVKMDPKYADQIKKSPLEDLKKEEEKRNLERKKKEDEEKKKNKKPERPTDSKYALRSQEIDISKLKKFDTPDQDPKKGDIDHEGPTEEALKIQSQALEEHRKAYMGLLAKRSETDPTLKASKNKSQLPGLKILQVVPIVLDLANDRISVESGLIFLKALELQVELSQLEDAATKAKVREYLHEQIKAEGGQGNALRALLTAFKLEFDRVTARTKAQSEKGQATSYGYLLDSQLQREISNAYLVLIQRPWISQHASQNKCEALLHGK